MSKPQPSQVQPNAGWGFLCVTCRYTFPDERKYAAFHPDLPCMRVRHLSFRHNLVPDLVAWNDETETCDEFEQAAKAKEER